jgi:hypothetical protein
VGKPLEKWPFVIVYKRWEVGSGLSPADDFGIRSVYPLNSTSEETVSSLFLDRHKKHPALNNKFDMVSS